MIEHFLNRRMALGASLLVLACGATAQTGDWPNKPIKLIVSGPAGSGGDIFARMIAASLQTALKATIVVENKAGANGIIGNDAAAKSPPDGYTFLFTPSSSIAINPVIQPKMPYDTQKDLLPVAQIGAAGILLIASPSTGFKSLNDMVQYAKANPGKLTYGSWGNGSTGHLAMEGIKVHYGLDMPHVPYKGTAPLLQDLIGDNIKVGFLDIASPIPHVRAGKVVAIGATGSGRGPAMPELATVSEQGYKFDADGWYGLFAPGGTPMPIVRRVNEELNKILYSDEMRQKFAVQNMLLPQRKSAEQFASTVRSDMELWQNLAKTIKLKIE